MLPKLEADEYEVQLRYSRWTVRGLETRLRHGKEIAGETLRGFVCLGCCRQRTAVVRANNRHRVTCIWNYDVECMSCRTVNNLVHFTDKADGDCGCNPKFFRPRRAS